MQLQFSTVATALLNWLVSPYVETYCWRAPPHPWFPLLFTYTFGQAFFAVCPRPLSFCRLPTSSISHSLPTHRSRGEAFRLTTLRVSLAQFSTVSTCFVTVCGGRLTAESTPGHIYSHATFSDSKYGKNQVLLLGVVSSLCFLFDLVTCLEFSRTLTKSVNRRRCSVNLVIRSSVERKNDECQSYWLQK